MQSGVTVRSNYASLRFRGVVHNERVSRISSAHSAWPVNRDTRLLHHA